MIWAGLSYSNLLTTLPFLTENHMAFVGLDHLSTSRIGESTTYIVVQLPGQGEWRGDPY